MLRTIAQVFGSSNEREPLCRWVPYSGFLNDNVFLTKTGALGITLAMEGCEYETRTQAQLEHISKKLVVANRLFDKRFRIYHQLLKRQGAQIKRRQDYGSVALNRLIPERAESMEARGLYGLRLYTTVLLEGRSSGFPLLDRLIEKRLRRDMDMDLTQNLVVLQDAVYSYASELGGLLGVSVLEKEACYQHLRALLNPEIDTNARLKYDTNIDYFAADTTIVDRRSKLEWGSFDTRVFTLKEEPDSTVAHLLRDVMRIDGNFTLTIEWHPTERAPMIEKIKRQRRRVWSQRTSALEGAIEGNGAKLIEDSASSDNAQSLNDAIREMRNRGAYFCDYSLTAAVFDRDAQRLRRACQDLKQVFNVKDATLLEEGPNRKRAFFAMLPGNNALNLRYRSLLNANIADLTPCYRPNEGTLTNEHLADEYMTVMESADGTPVYLNLHHGEVASTLITGTTGSGKSMLLDQFIDDGQKYDPFTFIIDVGGSHRLITKRHGGAYAQVRLNAHDFGINPFRRPYNPQSVNTILEFLRVLLANEGHTVTAEQEQLLLNEIHAVYGLPEQKRRMGRMSLPKALREKMHMWLNGGPFSHFVDSERDDLAVRPFQTWDFTDLEQVPKLLGPLTWYVSHWTSAVVTDPALSHRAKACYMDEGWRFGDLRDFIRSAAKTWRKHRAWIVFATQDEEDLREADLLNLLNTSCHTKIFLSNPGAELAVYGETFKLNERERQLLEEMKIGEFILKTPTESRKCIYRPSPARLAEYQSQFQNESMELQTQL